MDSPETPSRPIKVTGDSTAYYYAVIEGRAAGPYTIEGIESLVFLQKIKADTLVCRAGDTAYLPLKVSELGPVMFPKIPDEKGPEDWARPGEENNAAHLNRKRYRMTEATFEKVNGAPGQQPRIDVYNILGEIRQSEIESGRDFVRLNRFKLSKRSKDFWIMIIAGNGLLYGGALIFQNPISFVFAIGGSGLYTFALIWTMYGVMDRY